MLKCSNEKLNQAFEKIASACALYLPVDAAGGTAEFKKWEKGDEWSSVLNTNRSAKDFFFPQTENLVEFKTSGKTIEINDIRTEKETFVIFGVRACDVKSFDILDSVYLTEPVDSFYKSRREAGIIVSVACAKPLETCFCGSFGINAAEPDGDCTAWRTADGVYFKANTEKGEKFIGMISEFLQEADDASVEEQKKKTGEVMKRIPLAELSLSPFGGGKTGEFFDAPEWSELSESCLGCGTCTFVCPTCQCYDIKEFKAGDKVKRFRCWDSCMYSDFTKMAHGNPRLTQKERFRQRFMHKLVYYPENNKGVFGCVGCGRCLAKCPISMNIVKVIKKLGGNNNE